MPKHVVFLLPEQNFIVHLSCQKRYSERITGVGKAYILLFTNVCTIFFSCNPTLSLLWILAKVFSLEVHFSLLEDDTTAAKGLLQVLDINYDKSDAMKTQKFNFKSLQIFIISYTPHITFQFSAFLGYLKRKMKSILLKILQSLLCIVFSLHNKASN